jgi:hypothetical protein
MNREQAVQTWRSLVGYFDPDIPAGLNQEGLAGLSLAGRELYAEFQPEAKVLALHAVICRWPGQFDQHRLDSLQALTNSESTGGGRLNYQPENGNLFLSRFYSEPPELPQFVEDAIALTAASAVWDERVVDRVFMI